VANTTTAAALATMVIWLSTKGSSAAAMLAEGTHQPTTRRLHPLEGEQHDSTTLAYSCHHRHPSPSRWQRPCGYAKEHQGNSNIPVQKFLSYRVWIVNNKNHLWGASMFTWELNFYTNLHTIFNFTFVVFNFLIHAINKLHNSRRRSGFETNPPLMM
jgi:hypothetical protein